MACVSPSNILLCDAVQKITRNNLHQTHFINHCQPKGASCATKDHSLKFAITHGNGTFNNFSPLPSNLTDIAEELVELRKQGNFIVSAKDIQNIQRFTDQEILQWLKPNYITIGFITLAALFTWYTHKPLQPLDIALNHLTLKEQLEALKLKQEIAEYDKDLLNSHPNIIRIGD